MDGMCRCPEGHGIKSMDTVTCVQVLDSPCSEIALCSDPSKKRYKFDLFSIPFYDTTTPTNVVYKSHYCNVENICKCAPGYKRSSNGSGCQPLYGSHCTSSQDCRGDSSIYTEGYRCTANVCECNSNFYSYLDYNDYREDTSSPTPGWYHVNVYTCRPIIGKECLFGGSDLADGAECRHTDTLQYNTNYYPTTLTMQCISGVEENGRCKEILGSDCSQFGETCKLVENAECNQIKVCTCKQGFWQNGDACFKYTGTDVATASVC
ncbi:uncharacterized protein LOC127834326 [Dreissena polymorpha]|uniref:uncharacterized protein LOC127834326 n=1 Tax=Dreissena polymorpha TaxID=45954 RepID=UPI0022649DB9|nr:uncharacterized protein LOC127834326 [Dreissena polymorpha]